MKRRRITTRIPKGKKLTGRRFKVSTKLNPLKKHKKNYSPRAILVRKRNKLGRFV